MKAISKLYKDIKKDTISPLAEQPACEQIQQRLETYWKHHIGICAPYTRPLLFNSGRLVVFCDSSTWVTQLRCQAPSIIHQLKSEEFLVTKVEPKIIPSTHARKQSAKKRPNPVSKKSADSVASTSQIFSNQKLQTAMNKLAIRLKKQAKKSANPLNNKNSKP